MGVCIVYSIVLSCLLVESLNAIYINNNVSNHFVYYFAGHPQQARQLAKDYGLIYISEVFPRSHLHHAIYDERDEYFQRSQRLWISFDGLVADPRVGWVSRQVYQPREFRYIPDSPSNVPDTEDFISNSVTDPIFNDPLYPKQWYLHGKNDHNEHNLNVVPVWNQGITGKSVSIVVLDDNVNPLNPDITSNYDPYLSGNLSDGHEENSANEGTHGTFCAAIIAATANNSICGVGVAYHARVGGVRLLVKRHVLDVQEAKALNYKLRDVDIYSASWGPPDDGEHVGGPGHLSYQALVRGIEKGRKGLGVIYIWASGNGGVHGDHCSYDGYATSIYTLTVSALTPEGLSPYYAEDCPATLTSVYVGGRHEAVKKFSQRNLNSDNVIVPNLNGECKTNFQGTSAAAPLVAGVIALLLETNPSLSWRDVQHLVILSSSPPNKELGWITNGAGLHSHTKYGFGALNAAKLIEIGRNWKSVPPQRNYNVKCIGMPRLLNTNSPVVIPFDVLFDKQLPVASKIGTLEYVMITVDIDSQPRSLLTISLQSPSGTASQLIMPRLKDKNTKPLGKWNITTAQFWNENPIGQWRLYIGNVGTVNGIINSCSLTIYGF